MFERKRAFKNLAEEIRLLKRINTDDSGRKLVKVGLAKNYDFLSPLSPNGEPCITEEVAQFLEHSTKHLRPDYSLHFVFEGTSLSDEEKRIYTSAIHNYYHNEFTEIVRELQKNMAQTIIMVAVSAVIFALNIFLKNSGENQIIYNIIDIIAWVFAWEATDIFFLQRPSMRLRRLRLFNIIQSTISFE